MKRGPKPKAQPRRQPSTAIARHDPATAHASARPPVMPEYMADDPALEPARTVWLENIERVVANGATEADSDLFARYCAQEARYRAEVRLFMAGGMDAPPVSLAESLRKMGETLGLTGPASRTAIGKPAAQRDNAFMRNGRRAP